LVEPLLHPDTLLARLEALGVRMVAFGPRRLRAVTHLDIGDAAVDRAIAAMREAVSGSTA
jgi:hypothetical protein